VIHLSRRIDRDFPKALDRCLAAPRTL